MTDTPKVTIGMPVFNAERTVARALESLLAQHEGNFELVVSDNASVDGTEAIVRAFAARDLRVRYVRQPRNLGALANFRYVLHEARGAYFMWAAADDAWHPDFVAANVAHLDAHPDYAASVSRVQIGDLDPDRIGTQGTFALASDVDANLLAYVLRPGANSRFYGVHRTQAILAAWLDANYLAGDWAIVCRVVERGKYHEVPRVLMFRGNEGASRRMYQSTRALNLGWLDTWLPMRPYTRFVLRYPCIRRSPRALAWLLWLNANASRKMVLGWVRSLRTPRAGLQDASDE